MSCLEPGCGQATARRGYCATHHAAYYRPARRAELVAPYEERYREHRPRPGKRSDTGIPAAIDRILKARDTT